MALCCGGFQANPKMMREHFGDGGDSVPLLAPRARFNGGDGAGQGQLRNFVIRWRACGTDDTTAL